MSYFIHYQCNLPSVYHSEWKDECDKASSGFYNIYAFILLALLGYFAFKFKAFLIQFKDSVIGTFLKAKMSEIQGGNSQQEKKTTTRGKEEEEDAMLASLLK